jgi:RecA/RadA recombinase
VDWLWEPYIPFGGITFIDGDPGVGKSWLCLAICSIASQGGAFLGQDGKFTEILREPYNVLYLCRKHDVVHEVKPRIDVLGAGPGRIFVLRKGTMITLGDVDIIEERIQETGARLLVFDSLQSFLRNVSRANKARFLLPLAELAQKYNIAIIITRCLIKRLTSRSTYRATGPTSFTTIASSILLVGIPPGAKFNCSERIVAQVKNSFAPKGKSISFEIKDGQFFWKGLSELKANDLLKPGLGRKRKRAILAHKRGASHPQP